MNKDLGLNSMETGGRLPCCTGQWPKIITKSFMDGQQMGEILHSSPSENQVLRGGLKFSVLRYFADIGNFTPSINLSVNKNCNTQ